MALDASGSALIPSAAPNDDYTVLWESQYHKPKVNISIIVPAYNTEAYIEDSLSSLLSAGNDFLELIIIDDGSNDGTKERILRWLQENEPQGTFIQQVNGGPSTARNRGLHFARGEFVAFFDSDDLADAPTYRQMLSVAQAHNTDVVLARSVCFDARTLALWDFADRHYWDLIVGNQDIVVTRLSHEPRLIRLEASPVVRLYRRSFIEINKLKFPEGVFFEDIPFHVKTMLDASSVALLNRPLLYYRVNRFGQTTASQGKRRFDIIRICKDIMDLTPIYYIDDEVGANLAGSLCNYIFWCGKYSCHEDRRIFFEQALNVLAAAPATWLEKCLRKYAPNEETRIVIEAFRGNEADVLVNLSLGNPHTIEILRGRLPENRRPRSGLLANLRNFIRRIKYSARKAFT